MTIGNSKLVIFYVQNLKKENQIIKLCRQLGLQTRNLKQDDINTAVGVLAGVQGLKTAGITENVKAPDGYNMPELIIFSGLSDEILDKFLAEYRKAEIEPVGLKAMLTPHNITWTVYQLAAELIRERTVILLGKQ